MKAAWVCALLVAACAPPDRSPRAFEPSAAPVRGGILRAATYMQVRTLDPAISYDEVSNYAAAALYDTLIGYPAAVPGADDAQALTLEPHLAETWALSPDGREYRFTLRPDLRYADGSPLVADDFRVALEHILRTPDSPFVSFLAPLEGAAAFTAGEIDRCTGIVVEGDRGLRLRLTAPSPAFAFVLAMKLAAPVPARHLAAVGEDARRRPLASGAFQLDGWTEGTELRLRRNPHFWNAPSVWLDGVDWKENVPRDVAFLMFERGELDVVDRLASPDLVWMLGQAAWRPYVQQAMAMNVYGERMNVTRPPFDDVRVRRAMNYALNKDHQRRLMNGGATIAHGILPPGMLGYDATLTPYPHDPAKARALLAEAGYPDGFEIEYVTLADTETEKLAASLQADLAEVGVTVHIKLMSFATYLQAVGSVNGPAFSFSSWMMDYPDPSNFMNPRFSSSSIADENATNDSFYRNPTLDALLEQAAVATDPAARVAMYHQAERILYDDAPWIWSYHRDFIEVNQPYVRDYRPHPVWTRDFATTWLDPRGRP